MAGGGGFEWYYGINRKVFKYSKFQQLLTFF